MVSTRHHPRPFPEPTLTPGRSHNHTSTTSTSSSPTKETPPSPTEISTIKRRSTSMRRKTLNASSESTVTPTPRSSSRRARVSPTQYTYTHRPTLLMIIWLLISMVLVTWDTLYVIGRPHTMPGGKYHSPFWSPYELYGRVDYMYGWPAWNDNNGFTAAQGSLNAVELLMYGFYLYIMAREVEDGWNKGGIQKLWSDQEGVEIRGRLVAEAVVVCFAACVMTVSKTVLYWLNEAFSSFHNIGHNSAWDLWWLWVVPNGAWLVLPSYIIYVLWKEITQVMRGESTKRT